MMRRLTKEELLTFDGRPLFPERRAYTAQYELSDAVSRCDHLRARGDEPRRALPRRR
jgi:hypothetical protein